MRFFLNLLFCGKCGTFYAHKEYHWGRHKILRNYWIWAPAAPVLSHALNLIYAMPLVFSIMSVREIPHEDLDLFSVQFQKMQGQEGKYSTVWSRIFFWRNCLEADTCYVTTCLSPLLTPKSSSLWLLLNGYTIVGRNPRTKKVLFSLFFFHYCLILVFLFSLKRTWSCTRWRLWQIFHWL